MQVDTHVRLTNGMTRKYLTNFIRHKVETHREVNDYLFTFNPLLKINLIQEVVMTTEAGTETLGQLMQRLDISLEQLSLENLVPRVLISSYFVIIY